MSTAVPHPSPLPSGERSTAKRPGEGAMAMLNSPSPHPSPRRGEGAGRVRPRGMRPGLAVMLLVVVAVLAGVAAWIAALGPAPTGEGIEYSTLVVDREGRLLRPYPTVEGRWRLPATTESVDPRFFALLLAYEDKRFRSHSGVDPWALARAAWQFVTHGRIVSGGSTLTMQVARLIEPRAERNIAAKLRQVVRAIALERLLSKDQILALYLSLAPYGGNLEGIRAASLVYFGKGRRASAKRPSWWPCRNRRRRGAP